MRKPTKVLDIVTGDILWAIILVPILAISWVGFYTIARAVGIPVIFAAGMSAAFDGVAIFAARIGLKHRRNGFSGYLARITVLAFVGIGVFVQSFHGRAEPWIHAHSWIVWSVAPIAACIAYELHLGWTNRKRLIKMGYYHPSAKSGFGPATWLLLKTFGEGGTLNEYKGVLRARRSYIVQSNNRRFLVEESMQPQLPVHEIDPATLAGLTPDPTPAPVLPKPQPRPRPRPKPVPAQRPALASVPSTPTRKQTARTGNAAIAVWCENNGFTLGYNRRVPVEGLRAYRAAQTAKATAA